MQIAGGYQSILSHQKDHIGRTRLLYANKAGLEIRERNASNGIRRWTGIKKPLRRTKKPLQHYFIQKNPKDPFFKQYKFKVDESIISKK
jgi:hypothetical protein